MDRPPTRYQDPRSSNPLNKSAGIKLFRATIREQSQGLQRTRKRYRSEGGHDASRPADLNRPENIRESSMEHQHSRFLKNTFEPITRVQSDHIQTTLTVTKPTPNLQSPTQLWTYKKHQTQNNRTKGHEQYPTESHTKSTTVTETALFQANSYDPKER